MSLSAHQTPRSSSRSKRSTTNLANLRLAPLSARFTEPSTDKGGKDELEGGTVLSASYRSAPTSPRISSRTGERRYASGLSRRSSLYENDPVGYDAEGEGEGYFGGVKDEQRVGGPRLEISSGQVPKAKSEAALGVPRSQQRLAGHGVQLKRKKGGIYSPSVRTSGTNTPRVRVDAASEEDWLVRTGVATSNILQEQKGQSFLASRNSQPTLQLATQDLTDEDDEGYEEMAAISARTTRSQFADDELSPISTRASRWGSRYGSRAASRRTSRRGSQVQVGAGARTPTAMHQVDSRAIYDAELPVEADFEDSSADEGAASRFSSLGGIVDRIIGLNLFHVEEREETGTESEVDGAGETETEARQRRVAESGRRREEKERLQEAQQRSVRDGLTGNSGWTEDAKWLMGVAKEAMF